MEQIPFKADDTLALWQLLVLIVFCGLLVALAIVARKFSKRGKAESLLKALNLKPAPKSLQNVEFGQRVLSRHAKLYYLRIAGKQHLIFESDKGLIKLDDEVQPDD